MDECKPLIAGRTERVCPDALRRFDFSAAGAKLVVGRCRLTLSNPC